MAYTGGHDNDTTVGWWTSGIADSTRSEEDLRREREFAGAYLNMRGEPIQWAMIRALMASVADTVLIPMQDVLGLGGAGADESARTDGRQLEMALRAGRIASGDGAAAAGAD